MSLACGSPCSITWLGLQRLIQADVKSRRMEVTQTPPSFSARCTAPAPELGAELPNLLSSAVTVPAPSANKPKHRNLPPAVHSLCSTSHPSDSLHMAIPTQTVRELSSFPLKEKPGDTTGVE